MHRSEITQSLEVYRKHLSRPSAHHSSFDLAEELKIIDIFAAFIASTPACFERTHAAGHITGSAMVVSQGFDQVLLTLHGKLNKWLQLGGHSDGNPKTYEVSLREVEEESGVIPMRVFEPLRQSVSNEGEALPSFPLPFDFDYHLIPARKTEGEHIHYDVRYLVVADETKPPVISDESHDLGG